MGCVGAGNRLVALGRVEDELADELAGGGVDDADVQVLDEHKDAGSGVGSADADGVEPALVAQGDFPGLVDLVTSDSRRTGSDTVAMTLLAGSRR